MSNCGPDISIEVEVSGDGTGLVVDSGGDLRAPTRVGWG